jgi:5'-3' exonuclease
MTNYILLDLANLFFRSRHTVKGESDIKVGMAFHITLNSIKKAWNEFNGDHVVFCLEGRSWRKDFYPPYKRNRTVLKESLTEREVEEDKIFWQAFEDFKTFIIDKTNCTVLQHNCLEADDLIAGFIQEHPNDNHIIISTDSDFYQLIAENVKQYNGVTDTTITNNGFFDEKGKLVIDTKTKKTKETIEPAWFLFEKCIRGDSTDNIFSAYPKIRKNKLREAFEDRNSKGFLWHNLMLQQWTDHEGNDHKVIDDYERNRRLIDLSYQPDEIKKIIKTTIKNKMSKKNIDQVGLNLLKFCGKFDLVRISEKIQQYAEPLNAKYPG